MAQWGQGGAREGKYLIRWSLLSFPCGIGLCILTTDLVQSCYWTTCVVLVLWVLTNPAHYSILIWECSFMCWTVEDSVAKEQCVDCR